MLADINIQNQNMRDLADSVGCEVLVWPFITSVFPWGKNPRVASFGDLIICKVSKYLDSWKGPLFFQWGGYLVMLVQDCPLFHLSFQNP